MTILSMIFKGVPGDEQVYQSAKLFADKVLPHLKA